MFKSTSFLKPRFSCACILCAALFGSTAPVYAQVLGLESARELAQHNNLNLSALRAHSAAAEARIAGADALPDPKLQYTYFGRSVETRTGPQEAIYSLSQTVPWLTKLSTRKNIALKDSEIFDLAVRSAEWMLHEAVTARFAEASYLSKAIQATEAQLDWIENAQEIGEQTVRTGGSLMLDDPSGIFRASGFVVPERAGRAWSWPRIPREPRMGPSTTGPNVPIEER